MLQADASGFLSDGTQRRHLATNYPMHIRPPRKVMVEASVAGDPSISLLRGNLRRSEFQVVERIPAREDFDPDVLEVAEFRGRFLRPCPGTRCYHCCGYKILHFGTGCSLGCTYCILQAYLNQPNLRLFGNTEELFHEVEQELNASPETLFRIGTGEFTDSLLLDPWTGFSRRLVPFFARQPNAILELKTKTHLVKNLANLNHGGHTIVAWSLNAASIAEKEEAGAASLALRLKAARSCAQWGYRLAFHFDPMLEFAGWRGEYGEILNRIFDCVDPDRIVWISLGAFRYMPELKPLIQRRYPRSLIPYGEFIKGLDKKMRYFREIRVELYGYMVERIRRLDPGLCVYLCMEGRDIWRDAFGFSPDEKGGLPAMLDEAVYDRMEIKKP